MNAKKMPPSGSTQFTHPTYYNPSSRIQEALQFIEPSNRETWWRMAMAIKSELDESGFDIWLEWSQRAVRHLVENGIASTADIAGNCAIGNVSDAVLRVQPQLQKHGVCIAHTHPQGFTNRFGEPTPMHLWWLALVEPVGVSQ